jgi:hypothetical protein
MVAAIFAGYMIARESGPEGFNAAEHRLIVAPASGGRDSKPAAEDPGRGTGPFDFDATGSIIRGREDAAVRAPQDVRPAVKTGGGRPGEVGGAAGYVLRFVHRGVAIVQIAGKSYVVAPGAALPQAGRVLAIEKRAGRWVVVTVAGLIVEAP